MSKEIGMLYDEVYQMIDQHLDKVREIEQLDLSEASDEEIEKLERMDFALQAAKDILENMIMPGKKLTFTYKKGLVGLEIFDNGKA